MTTTTSASDSNKNLLAELTWTAGELRLRVFHENAAHKSLIDVHSSDPEFNDLVHLLKLDMHASLVQMEHDLMSDCCCETCFRVEEIKQGYAR